MQIRQTVCRYRIKVPPSMVKVPVTGLCCRWTYTFCHTTVSHFYSHPVHSGYINTTEAQANSCMANVLRSQNPNNWCTWNKTNQKRSGKIKTSTVSKHAKFFAKIFNNSTIKFKIHCPICNKQKHVL